MSKTLELTGRKFGRLTVIKRTENKGKSARWECLCECGKTTNSHTYSLTSGRAKSCGCLGHENVIKSKTKHGRTKTRIHNIWLSMKKRCFNEKNDNYKYYGGKGITVCEEWLNSEVFITWALENGYQENLELDRIDSNKNYEPNNCRWATRITQMRNRSNTVFLEYENIKKPLAEWCEKYNISYKNAIQRLRRGKSFEEIFEINKEKK